MTVHERLAEVSLWLLPRLADHLWQTSLFVAVIVAICFALRKGPARLRHTFWLLAAAKFLVPVSLLVLLFRQLGIDSLFLAQNALIPGITEPVATLTIDSAVITTVGAAGHNEVYCALTTLWIAGMVALHLVWGIRRRRFGLSLQLGQSNRLGREWRVLQRAKESIFMKRKVGLVISPQKIEPGVWRVWRPTIVLPESIAHVLDDDELEAIMLHELAHIQRRDNLIGSLQSGLCALFWFNPLAWFIRRKLFDEREQACDEKVMEIFGAPEAYASSILKVVRFCFGWKVAGATGAASGSNLRRRIENIMSMENTKHNPGSARRSGSLSRLLAGITAGLAFIVLVGAGLYARASGENITAAPIDSAQFQTPASEASTTEPLAPVEKATSGVEQTKPVAPPAPAAPTAPAIVALAPAPAAPTAPATSAMTTPPATPPAAPSAPAAPTAPVKPQEKTAPAEKKKDNVTHGRLITAPHPDYPKEAKKQKVEGTVSVEITIGEEGNVISAKATDGPEMLHEASKEAAYKARFTPTLVNGKPAKVAGALSYRFVLDKEEKEKDQ